MSEGMLTALVTAAATIVGSFIGVMGGRRIEVIIWEREGSETVRRPVSRAAPFMILSVVAGAVVGAALGYGATSSVLAALVAPVSPTALPTLVVSVAGTPTPGAVPTSPRTTQASRVVTPRLVPSPATTPQLPGKRIDQPSEVTRAWELAVQAGAAGLVVCLQNADGSPRTDVYAEVYSQVEDVSGAPTYGERLSGKSTDQTGCAAFGLDPGTYIVRMDSFRGYAWGNMGGYPGLANVGIGEGSQTVLRITTGRLNVGISYADGRPFVDRYVEVWTQQDDVNGNPVRGQRVGGSSTDNRGWASFSLTPGTYAVYVEFRGNNWGSATDGMGQADVRVSAGQATSIVLEIGALVIERRDAVGNAAAGVYCELYVQVPDVAGNPATWSRLAGASTDGTGRIGWSLTAGTYAVKVGEETEYDIVVDWGKTTYVDGTRVLRTE